MTLPNQNNAHRWAGTGLHRSFHVGPTPPVTRHARATPPEWSGHIRRSGTPRGPHTAASHLSGRQAPNISPVPEAAIGLESPESEGAHARR